MEAAIDVGLGPLGAAASLPCQDPHFAESSRLFADSLLVGGVEELAVLVATSAIELNLKVVPSSSGAGGGEMVFPRGAFRPIAPWQGTVATLGATKRKKDPKVRSR